MSDYQSINIDDITADAEKREKSLLLKPLSPKTERCSKNIQISVYVLLSTLFFGFTIGFTIGFYAFGEFACDENIGTRVSTTEFMNKLNADSFHTLSLTLLPFQTGPSRQLIYLNRADAYELLVDSTQIGSSTISTISQYSNDFFLILSGLDVQINQAYCGTATAVAILNSLRYLRSSGNHKDGVEIPVDLAYAPYSYATQSDIFGECTKNTVISQTGGGIGIDGILTPPFGLNMGQVAKILRCHLDSNTDSGGGTWSVDTHFADTTHVTLNKMRYDLKNALIDPSRRVLVNYNRTEISQQGGAHWSPVGSYSEKWDAFLILDVAKYKYPPAWIPAERLFAAMATVDDCGVWDYPNAQDKLSTEERSSRTNSASIKTKLGCLQQLRGYITVTKES